MPHIHLCDVTRAALGRLRETALPPSRKICWAAERWWARQDSNLRQRRYERRVLTAELRARVSP